MQRTAIIWVEVAGISTTQHCTMKDRRVLEIEGGDGEKICVGSVAFFAVSHNSHLYDDHDGISNRFLNEDTRVVLVHGYLGDMSVTVKAHLDKYAADELAATLVHVQEACPAVKKAVGTPQLVATGTCGVRTLVGNGMVISKGLLEEGGEIRLHCVVQTYMPGYTAEHFVSSAPDRLLAAEPGATMNVAAIDLEHWTWRPSRGYTGVVPGANFPPCAADPTKTTRDWSIFTWEELQASEHRDNPSFDPRNFIWTRVIFGLRNEGVAGNEMAIAITGKLARDVKPYFRPLIDRPVADDASISAFLDDMEARCRNPDWHRPKKIATARPRQNFDISYLGIAHFLRHVQAFATACSEDNVYPFDGGKLANWVVCLKINL